MDHILQLLLQGRVPNANLPPSPFFDGNAFWTDVRLIEMRQVRAFAGLDTRLMDVEITRRVLNNPQAWGVIGCWAICQDRVANRAILDEGY
jgi:hypothetical protein